MGDKDAAGDGGRVSQSLQVRMAAMEVILRRLVSEGERATPGLIDRLAGPYDFHSRPSAGFDAFVGEVDDQVSTLLALARIEAKPRRGDGR